MALTSCLCYNCSNPYRLKGFLRNFSSARRNRDILPPATALKPTPDVKYIRQNADIYAQNYVDRNCTGHAGYRSNIQQLLEESAHHGSHDPLWVVM
jgi:seryl-tRNA synthetase